MSKGSEYSIGTTDVAAGRVDTTRQRTARIMA